MSSGLYIHIPFCRTKCPYCDFYSVTRTEKMPSFIASLTGEMELYRGLFGPFDTIYLGGGTPSLLSSDQIKTILDALRGTFSFAPDTEITCETNPGDLTPETAEVLHAAGINRITIGVQSFDDGVLAFLGRRHNAAGAVAAIENARQAGFANVGLDLIYGVPGQAIDRWLETLGEALSFAPEHLSCYQLTLEPSTPLGRKLRRKEFISPQDNLLHDFFIHTSETLEEAGYIHYEVSNFARGEDRMSRHNRKYWNHTPYLGLGPAAHSFAGRRRWWNHRSLDRYIAAADRGMPPIAETEILAGEQLLLESLYLGMRTREGIDLETFAERYGCDLIAEKGTVLSALQDQGLITIQEGRLRPTRAGLAVSDSLPVL
jgi:oxygen-independent coproporphyrinogen-3 oxidase